jgi:hypothetical protein
MYEKAGFWEKVMTFSQANNDLKNFFSPIFATLHKNK